MHVTGCRNDGWIDGPSHHRTWGAENIAKMAVRFAVRGVVKWIGTGREMIRWGWGQGVDACPNEIYSHTPIKYFSVDSPWYGLWGVMGL